MELEKLRLKGVYGVVSNWHWKDVALVSLTGLVSLLAIAYVSSPPVTNNNWSSEATSSMDQCEPGGWLTPSDRGGENAWHDMKVTLAPAKCSVKGKWTIEELDPEHNFRRAYALGFTGNVEDKVLVLPYMLATQDKSLSARKRRVYIDFGANRFGTSILWMNRNYPLDFTEIHTFEVNPTVFRLPPNPVPADVKAMDSGSVMVHGPRTENDIPQWMLARINFYQKFVQAVHNPSKNHMGATHFIKEELKLTKDDAVIVKMDIEGAEWDILPEWLEDLDMADIVDELFVEIHYKHPSMMRFGWGQFPHTREEATNLLVRLRDRGFYVHCWP